MQPLTPPPYLDHITLPNIEDWPNTDPDSEPAVEDWLQLRCPNLNIKELMSSYNKVTIPVEENFRLLWRLRSVVNAATDGDAESAVMQTLKDLESERVKSDERCRYIGQRLFFHNPFPDGEGAIWEALVRSKNLLSVNEAISTLFPYLFEKVNTETSEAKTTEQSVSTQPKKTNHSRVAKPRRPQRSETRKQNSTTKRRLRDKTDKRGGSPQKMTTEKTSPLRRSPRFTRPQLT
ncbi:hypothetical protein PV05_03426 [Exophiala xenobiotica]|uniref:Uncharacterized protein n=1 Tax=Exophiala xenobiotica TaxID=348802 RepID=A0A0D2FFQ3_9EURO|nr:uncharacterized protein PV05_03426 [Exophiala xenobiotica]KIW58934.1 hypothetical protein PV05_03426 [Exophiala xenobiotica]